MLYILLLSSGALIDARTVSMRDTPLHWASSEGHLNIVKLLVEEGADIYARNLDGGLPYHYVVYGTRNLGGRGVNLKIVEFFP